MGLLKQAGLLSDVRPPLPARGVRPSVTEGTAAGPVRRVGQGRVVPPILRLGAARVRLLIEPGEFEFFSEGGHLFVSERAEFRQLAPEVPSV